MSKQALDTLTETMFYVLMSFHKRDMFGTEIADFVKNITDGRVNIGPGTLYTILSNFQKEKLIEKKNVEGRKITYGITPLGEEIYLREIERLKRCILDAQRQEEER